MKSLEDTKNLPISTTQDDLRNRIDFVFNYMDIGVQGTITEYAQAFLDVINFQSYAGAIPEDKESQLLQWIDHTYDKSSIEYNDVLSYLYSSFRRDIAEAEMKKRINSSDNPAIVKIFQDALTEL